MAKSSKVAPKKDGINKSAANPDKQKGNDPLRQGKKAEQPQAPPTGTISEEAAKGEPIQTEMGSKVQREGEEGD